MINILMIDDNVSLCEDLKLELLGNDEFDFDYRTNLHEGMEALISAQGSIDVLILGGRGLLSPEDTEKRDVHVLRGIKLTRQRFPHLPIFISTSWPEKNKELLMLFDEAFPVYEKTKSARKEMLDAIMRTVHEVHSYRVKRKYLSVLEVFEKGYLKKETDGLYKSFIDVLTHLYRDDFHEMDTVRRNGIYTSMRKIQEAIHQRITDQFPTTLPPEISSIGKQLNHLSGNLKRDEQTGEYYLASDAYMCSTVRSLSKLVRCSSSASMHFNDSEVTTSVFALKSTVYALLEVMEWYRNCMDSCDFGSSGVDKGVLDIRA